MPVLPPDFADLERFADWSLATEGERYAKRLASSLDETQELYDVVLARIEPAYTYLNQFPLAELPEDATRLLWLLYSFINVSFPVEAWRQPRVPDSGAASMECVAAPVP